MTTYKATAEDIIKELGLLPHPEGGYFRRTYCCENPASDRGYMSTIYYLMKSNMQNLWHQIDAAELWLWHAGSPVQLSVAADKKTAPATYLLGPDIISHERPQILIPGKMWNQAQVVDQTPGSWSLVSCCVSPEFVFQNLELAERGWQPGLPA